MIDRNRLSGPGRVTPIKSGPAADFVFATSSGLGNMTASVSQRPIEFLRPSPHHARKPGKGQHEAVEASCQRFGIVRPVLATGNGEIIDGHAIYAAAKKLGFARVPVILVDHFSDAEVRALRLTLNKTAERGVWDPEALKQEFEFLFQVDPDLTNFTGFEPAEIDRLLNIKTQGLDDDYGEVPAPAGDPVSRPGDLWLCEGQKFICGDASDPECYRKLLGTERSEFLLTDPPYGCKIKGHVSRKHGEFVEGSGYSEPEMIKFLGDFASTAKAFLHPGSLVYAFMDAAGLFAAQTALRQANLQQKALLVWDKQVGGMGTFYRQQAEFILVAKHGVGAHTNNIRLEAHGRNRTTVISYPGLSRFGINRTELLKLHPTIKPIGLIADLILDASERGDLVLDPFLGSGTTLLAAHRVGRRGRGIERDPKYVDVAVLRLQQHVGLPAIHATTGLTFDQLARTRTRVRPAAEPTGSPQRPKVVARPMRPRT